MLNASKVLCFHCGAAVGPHAQFCEHCGSAVPRGASVRDDSERWSDELENPTAPDMRPHRARAAAPAAPLRFNTMQLVPIGAASTLVVGIIAVLSAVVVISKGHTIGGGICLLAAALAFGILAVSGPHRS